MQLADSNKDEQRKSIGMGAGDRVKQFGRTDQPRPLVDRADSPCEQLLPRRSCSAFSGGYSLAEPQPLLVAFGTCRAKCAWRSAVSMRISMRKQRRAAGRPGALPNLRRICGHKTGVPTPQKGVRCGRPSVDDRMPEKARERHLFVFRLSTLAAVVRPPSEARRAVARDRTWTSLR